MKIRDGFRHLLTFVCLLGIASACSEAHFEKAQTPDNGAKGGPAGGGNGTGGGGGGGEEPPVCNPFGGPPPGSQNGVSGDLYYLNDSQPLYEDVRQYFQNGTRANAKLFMSDINVPTRYFDQGFATQGGTGLKRNDGTLLIEKFAMSVGSTIRLAAGDTAGYKQFAVLSDDGSIFTIKQNGVEKVLVDNNGVSPTKLGCGMTENILFDANTALPMRLDYFQGPRFHISVILLWRNAPNALPASDALCGYASNDEWFDSQNGSTPQQKYNELLARGWRPLRPQNYWLDGTNPCAQ